MQDTPTEKRPQLAPELDEQLPAWVDAAALPASAPPVRADVARLERQVRFLQKDIEVKDAYLATLRAELKEREADIESLSGELARVHGDIRVTLGQPRYQMADAVNRALRRFGFAHRLFKRLLAGAVSRRPPTQHP